MIVTHKVAYRDGELRIGWASWDNGSLSERSIKYAYKDASGKISRGAPELPLQVLVDMLDLALRENEINFGAKDQSPRAVESMPHADLAAEKDTLKSALVVLQKLIGDVPWVNVQETYDRIGRRYEDVKAALAK
jgi:hypothetical protein